jgi:hypothetical protein
MKMRENDIIAEYVKSKFPDILSTADFVLFKLGKTLRSVVQSSYEAYAEYESAIKECEEQQEAWKQQTMSRFERVE